MAKGKKLTAEVEHIEETISPSMEVVGKSDKNITNTNPPLTAIQMQNMSHQAIDEYNKSVNHE